MAFKKISIIIPLQGITPYLKESLKHLFRQDYRNFEILLLPNEPLKQTFPQSVRVIPVGNIQPAVKRNIGAEKAHGQILAFIDDDAYPADRHWLSRASLYFEGKEGCGAIGGPNLTPSDDDLFQQVSGEVLASWLFSGPASRRYKRGRKGAYHDLPSCNLFVDKNVFQQVQGFYPRYWPGEDTKLCSDILRAGKAIVYDPDIAVYHHRRKGWTSYLRQTFRFGFHRGIFMKLFPETSLRPIFFLPLLFVLGLFFGPWLGLLHPGLLTGYLLTLLLYAVLVFSASLSSRRFSTIPLFMLMGFLTHLSYGIGVLIGLFTSSERSALKPKHER